MIETFLNADLFVLSFVPVRLYICILLVNVLFIAVTWSLLGSVIYTYLLLDFCHVLIKLMPSVCPQHFVSYDKNEYILFEDQFIHLWQIFFQTVNYSFLLCTTSDTGISDNLTQHMFKHFLSAAMLLQ